MNDILNAVGAKPQASTCAKVEGRAQYIADLYRPGMLHGRHLGSRTRMRALGSDIREARDTGRALRADRRRFGDHRIGASSGRARHRQGKVLYVGEPVAAVAAGDGSGGEVGRAPRKVEYGGTVSDLDAGRR